MILTVKFKVPYTFEGVTHNTLELDMSLIGGDTMEQVENDMLMSGQMFMTPLNSQAFLRRIAVIASGKPHEFFGRRMHPANFVAVTQSLTNFLSGAESQESSNAGTSAD